MILRKIAAFWFLLVLLYLGFACGESVVSCKQGQECIKGERCVEGYCRESWRNDNRPPRAHVERVLRVRKGQTVHLDGSKSVDADLDHLTFLWSFDKRPSDSKPKIKDAMKAKASFVADKSGTYIAKLTVTDSVGIIDVSKLNIKVNYPPEANAGGEQLVLLGTKVVLWGSGSFDRDRDDVLKYRWKILKKPKNSRTSLNVNSLPISGFLADALGLFSFELEVRDGFEKSISRVSVRVSDPANIIPVLKELSPAFASTRSISVITLHGRGFIQGAKVLFQEQVMKSTYRSSEKVITTLDLRKVRAGDYKVKLVNPKGKTTKSLLFVVKKISFPLIESVSPDVLSAGKSLRIQIRGKDFVDGASILFDGKVFKSSYISSNQIEANLSIVGMKTGSYSLRVENDKNRRSNFVQVKVVQAPPKPLIHLHKASLNTLYVDRHFQTLRLYGTGLTDSTRLRINGTHYKGSLLVRHTSGDGVVILSNFNTIGWSPASHSFFLINSGAGKQVESEAYVITFSDPSKPSISSVRFYGDNNNLSPDVVIGRTYKRMEIHGKKIHSKFEVYINSKKYKGKVVWGSSSQLFFPKFSTENLNVGSFKIYVKNILSRRTNISNTIEFTTADGRTPSIANVFISEGGSVIDVNETYFFLGLSGYNFRPGIKVLLNGVQIKNTIRRKGSEELYVFQFKISGLADVKYRVSLMNTIGRATYRSIPFLLSVVDKKKTPTLINCLIQNSVLRGHRFSVNMHASNVSPSSTQVFINGLPYKGKIQFIGSLIKIPNIDSLGFTLGLYLFQLKNKVGKKYYQSSGFCSTLILKGIIPKIQRISPKEFTIKNNFPVKVFIYGSFFKIDSKLFLDGKKYKSIFNRRGFIVFFMDPAVLGAGSHVLQVINANGDTSNRWKFTVRK